MTVQKLKPTHQLGPRQLIRVRTDYFGDPCGVVPVNAAEENNDFVRSPRMTGYGGGGGGGGSSNTAVLQSFLHRFVNINSEEAIDSLTGVNSVTGLRSRPFSASPDRFVPVKSLDQLYAQAEGIVSPPKNSFAFF